MARALYIHWPFCLKKCPYCDFNSHVRNGVDHSLWEKSLLGDMRHEHAVADIGPLTSIFFGGGTPSLMPPELVERLLAQAEALWGFDPSIEITLEANPSSVEAGNFAALSVAGVNRVSLGLQSLDDEALGFLGRLHSVGESLVALDVAQSCFQRVSCDLIYARPGQSADQWAAELERAMGFGTSHLSLYQLTIEPGTRFATDVRRGVFEPLADDPAADLFALTQDLTAAAGLPAYEVSNHAAPGEESRHSLTYWRYEDYIGIGPGAHGRRGGFATQRHKKPENWLHAIEEQGNGLSEERPLNASEAAAEALMMGLRLREGVGLAKLSRRFGMPVEAMIDAERAEFYRNLGFLWSTDERLGVTRHGMGVLDALLGEVVSGELVVS